MNERIVSDQYIIEFREYLHKEEKSKNTIDKYIRDVHRFQMCAGHGTNPVGDKPTTGIYRQV